MITTTNMKLGLVLVAFVIQGSIAASEKYEYASVARFRNPSKKGAKTYTLSLDVSNAQTCKMYLAASLSRRGNQITNLEFELGADGYARKLGSGTFGGVFVGRLSTTTHAPIRVAIKIGEKWKYSNEAKHMEKLNNPAINKIYAHGFCAPPAIDSATDPRQVVVVELVNGKSLASHIKDRSPLIKNRNACISIVHQVANAMEYMWAQRLVHQDCANPNNIMIVQNRDSYQAVLIDFGKTQTFEECNQAMRGSNEYEKAADLQALATMCSDLGLHEHAKVFPIEIRLGKRDDGTKALLAKASPQARKYVHDLDYRPELNTRHLMPRPIDICSNLLPGLLGYAVCSKCQGQGNLAQQMSGAIRCNRCEVLRKRIDSKRPKGI